MHTEPVPDRPGTIDIRVHRLCGELSPPPERALSVHESDAFQSSHNRNYSPSSNSSHTTNASLMRSKSVRSVSVRSVLSVNSNMESDSRKSTMPLSPTLWWQHLCGSVRVAGDVQSLTAVYSCQGQGLFVIS